MRRTGSRSRESIPEEKLRELERKRRQWKKEQELLRQHEKRKAKMIAEYEERRARELGLKKRRRTSKSRSPSRSRSRTRPSSRRSRSRSRSTNRTKASHMPSSSRSSVQTPVMSEKCDATSSNTPFFKGREGKKIDSTELTKIKINIQRDIASSSKDTPKELLRDIVDPDEIVIKRREGEGSKPIFDREELKDADAPTSEVAERRTIFAVDSVERNDEKRTSSRPPRSHSSERYRSHSSRRSARYQNAREIDSRRGGVPNNRNEDRVSLYHRLLVRQDYTEHSFPGQPSIEGPSYRRNDVLPYGESMAHPMYYDNFARPMMVDPMIVTRPPGPLVRTRMPFIMNPYRGPPGPQLTPPEPYRFNFAQSQRYNRRF